MELGLRSGVRRIPSDRTRVPGQAAGPEASRTVGVGNVADATLHVIAAGGERADGTGRQARTTDARLARAGTVVARRKIEALAKRDGAPVGVPQAEIRVHQGTDG